MKISSLALSALLLVCTTNAATAQTPGEQTILNVFGRLNLTEENQYEYLNYWTDGSSFYRPFFYDVRDFDALYRSNGNTIFFVGGNLHEGGIGYEVALAADGTMSMAGDYLFNVGDRMEYRVIGDEQLLLISDLRTKAVKDVWKKLEGGSLRTLYLDNYLRYALAGSYKNADGKMIVFDANRFCVSGLWDGTDCTTYTFGEEDEAPVLTLVHPNKDRAVIVRKTVNGLELFPAIEEDEWGIWEKDESKPRITLVKTAEAHGAFTLASDHVMTLAALKLYAGTPVLQNLQIMRNEIFARHGYKFKTKDMADFFSTKAWYTPQYDDVTSRLTEIERINISLIQELEKRYEKQ